MSGPAPIRVLVVEDSSTVRKVVSDALNSDREITVIGTAANGRLGLVEVAKLEPDLVTLDIEMPEMDGLTMLSELRKTHPRLPVIMVSTLTGRGAAATLDALSRGASDYVTKPSSSTNTSATSAIEHFRRELIPRVKALCPRRAAPVAPARAPRTSSIAAPRYGGVAPASLPPAGSSAPLTVRPSRGGAGRFDLLAVGCSTGGPNAIETVLSALPGDLQAPVLLTQHMPPIFTKMLADRLDTKCALHVVEAEDGMELVNGTVYIAPGDYHLVLKRSAAGFAIATNQAPPENSCRPAVDVMFRSIAENYGARTFAVVMTGMGYDGRIGAGAIVAAGGEVIAQDQETSVVWGMPGAVAEAGLASEILPLGQIASAIERRFTRRPMPIQAAHARPAAAPVARPATAAHPVPVGGARPSAVPARSTVAVPARSTVATPARPSSAPARPATPAATRPPLNGDRFVSASRPPQGANR